MKRNSKLLLITCVVIVGIILAVSFTHIKKDNPDSATVESNQTQEASTSPSSNKHEPITPTVEQSNIDAIDYKTVNADKKGKAITVDVIVGNVKMEEVARFVLPYANFVQEYNDGSTSVTLELYTSQENVDAKKPSWEFKNGVLNEI